jgi:hypothetical protein
MLHSEQVSYFLIDSSIVKKRLLKT